MFWENNRIDFGLFTNQLLSDPSDSIQYSIELLMYQKDIVEKELPFLYDKELLRVNAKELKNVLIPFPQESLNRILGDLPIYLKQISDDINTYLKNNIEKLSKQATNVSSFVHQMKTMKNIQKKIDKIKHKAGFVGQISNIIEINKSNLILADK